jgi:autotransporter-associated beta strand protein
VNLSAGTALALAASNGLTGQFYSASPDSANFVSVSALDTHLAGLSAAAVANSSLVGPEFDYGNNGAGPNKFPAPFNTVGAENFEARWTGKFNAPTAGTYTFGTASDDGSVLFIDGALVVDNNFFQGETRRTGTVALQPGSHDIVVAYYQAGGGLSFRADVTVPGGMTQNIPNSMLSVHTNASIGSLNGGAGSTVTLNGGRLTINQTAPGTYAGLIVDGTFPGGRLVKGGDSTITLAGVNTYTGGTTLLSGGIGIANSSAFGPGVLAVEGNGFLFAAGSNRTIANNISIAVVTTLTVSDDPVGASNTLTLAGNISGLGTLAKVGAGTLILSGTNTQTGGIVISDGRVGIASDGAFGAGAIRLLGAAELFPIGAARTIARTVTVVNGPLIVGDVPGDSFDLTITGVLNAAGGLVKNGANTLVVNNYASAGGTATVNGGTLRFVAATSGSGNYQVNSDGRIQFASNALISPLIIAANDLLSTIEYSNGVRINGGSLFGPGNHVIGTGGATFTGSDLFNGVKLAVNAPLTMTATTSGAAVQVANNQTLTWNGGRMSAGGSLTLGQGAVASVRSFESSGRIVIQDGGEFDNSGTNLVSGGGGVIEVRAGGILSSAATTIELNGSLLVNNGTVDGTTNVNFGSLARARETSVRSMSATADVFHPATALVRPL